MPPPCLSLSFVDLTSLYCKLFLSPSPSLDRALLSKIIHTLIVQWQCQADLPIPTLYSFFTKAFAKAGYALLAHPINTTCTHTHAHNTLK